MSRNVEALELVVKKPEGCDYSEFVIRGIYHPGDLEMDATDVAVELRRLLAGVAEIPVDDSVASVASIYNDALQLGRTPLKEVMIQTGMPKATASRRVRAAKDAGLIG